MERSIVHHNHQHQFHQQLQDSTSNAFSRRQPIDPRVKVILKMDVSWKGHSHIIGRGGRQIQSVMDQTHCHIHFPDGNRTSTIEKSNQVSIVGTAIGSEQSRQMIRHFLPLTISFSFPMRDVSPTLLDLTHPTVQFISQKFSVAIDFKFNPDPHNHANYFTSNHDLNSFDPMVTVLVRGTRVAYQDLKSSIGDLWIHLFGKPLEHNSAWFSISMDITPKDHPFVMGRGGCNLKTVQSHTGSVVIFPDVVNAENMPPLMRSKVLIKGRNTDSIFMAWIELLGFLPLTIIFELPMDFNIDGQLIRNVIEQGIVSVLVRPKQGMNTRTIILKSHEKYSRILFDVRRKILGLDESEVPCEEYPLPAASQTQPTLNGAPRTTRLSSISGTNIDAPPFQPRIQSLKSTSQLEAHQTKLAQQQEQELVKTEEMLRFMLTQANMSLSRKPFAPSSQDMLKFVQKQLECMNGEQNEDERIKVERLVDSYVTMQSSRPSSPTPSIASTTFTDGYGTCDESASVRSFSSTGTKPNSPENVRKASQLKTGSTNPSPETLKAICDNANIVIEETGPIRGLTLDSLGRQLYKVNPLPRNPEPSSSTLWLEDERRMQAKHAMKSPIQPGQSRIPTSAWSGFGFSQTQPEAAWRHRLDVGLSAQNSAKFWRH